MAEKTAWEVLDYMFPGSGTDILDRLSESGFAVVRCSHLDEIAEIMEAIEVEVQSSDSRPTTGEEG